MASDFTFVLEVNSLEAAYAYCGSHRLNVAVKVDSYDLKKFLERLEIQIAEAKEVVRGA